MRGIHSNLVVTTATDEATGTKRPLFAFPVQICKATDNKEVRLDTAAPSGAPVQQVYRDTVTGDLVERGDLIKGVRTGDSFAQIPTDQITAIDEALKSDEIIVERTVDLADVPFERVTDCYFLQVPAKGGAHKSYRLLYEALQGSTKKNPAKALRVKFTSRTRQKLGVVYADTQTKCLILVTLNFAASVRQPDEQVLSHLNVEVEKETVAKARSVIEGLDIEAAGDWDTPVDETIERRNELVEQALAGDGLEIPEGEAAPVQASTDQVEEMLEASLAAL